MTRQGPRGAIATPHTLATRAGERAYAAGGNAVDAALAAAAVLAVVYPHNTALGGDLVALVRSPTGSTACINATGTAAAAVDANALARRYGAALPARGPDVITVPGAVRGWSMLHDLAARRTWSDHLADAVSLARDGVPVAPSLSRAISAHGDLLARDLGAAEVFRPGGRLLQEGELLLQPALADSLAELAATGADAMYDGSLGQRLVRGLRELGCPLTVADLRNYRAELVDPLAADFHGHRVLTSPPNTQGFVLLRALKALTASQADVEPRDIDPVVLARLFLEGNAIRDRELADPRATRADLHKHGLGSLVSGLRTSRPPSARGGWEPPPTGDTVGISAVDSEGWAVSLIESLFASFGAGILEPSTGILMHNRGRSFSLDPSSPNLVRARHRPRHTLMPVMVERNGRTRWVSSTMGGQAQPQIHVQVLLQLLDGATAQEAVSAPRWILGPRSPSDPPDTVCVEADVDPQVARLLAGADFTCRDVPSRDDLMGHANVVSVVADDELDAGADPRSDGCASVVPLAQRP